MMDCSSNPISRASCTCREASPRPTLVPKTSQFPRLFTLLLLGLTLSVQALSAQISPVEVTVVAEGEVQELVLNDGSVLYGRVVEKGDPFRFVLVSGTEMMVRVADVRSLRLAGGSVQDGEFWPQDPNRTRLFFGPTARTLSKGDGYLAVYEFLFPFLAYGISDSVILAGGFPLVFGEGQDVFPFYVAPKVRLFQNGSAEGAIGVLAFSAGDENAGILYGVLTNGTTKASVTLGAGWGFADGELADTPAIMLGGEARAGPGWSFVTENYLFPGGTGLISAGPRFFGRRLSADLGLAVPVGGEDWFVFPLINFVWNF